MNNNNFYIKHQSFSTDSELPLDKSIADDTSKPSYISTTTNEIEKASSVDISLMSDVYLALLTQFITYFDLKDNDGQVLEILFNTNDLITIDEDSIPFVIKTFCSNVRVASNSSFSRNLLEILLLPISRNTVINTSAIQFTRANPNNYTSYKEILFNNDIRKACIKYIDQLPNLDKSIITPKTSLRSFKRNTIVASIIKALSKNTLSQQERYLLVGLFLESVLFEIINNTENKYSKAIIPNFLIDIISKSGI